MEPRFDLIAARQTWRSALESQQTFTGAQLQELESHLEDTMEDLQDLGLPASEAFLLATHRLGKPAGLAGEYQKMTRHPAAMIRVKWMVLGIVSYLGALAVTRIGTDIVGLVTLQVPEGPVRLGVMASGFVASLALGLGLLHGCFRGTGFRWPGLMTRHPLGSACGILFAAFLLPGAVGALTSILAAKTSSPSEFAGQAMTRQYVLMAGSLAWLAILAFSLRNNWGKAPVVSS